jgi:exodeoxyribonuclease V alpha subunit
MIRARAGVTFALAEAMDEGHCGLPAEELRALAAALLEIPAELVDAALALELAEGAVVADTVEGRACVFLAGLHRAEQGIAERLLRLLDGSPPWPAVDPAQAIPWVECKAGITLAESQRQAVRLALRAKVLVVTGGPGVGKTTLVNTILQILRAKTPAITLAARVHRWKGRSGIGSDAVGAAPGGAPAAHAGAEPVRPALPSPPSSRDRAAPASQRSTSGKCSARALAHRSISAAIW